MMKNVLSFGLLGFAICWVLYIFDLNQDFGLSIKLSFGPQCFFLSFINV